MSLLYPLFLNLSILCLISRQVVVVDSIHLSTNRISFLMNGPVSHSSRIIGLVRGAMFQCVVEWSKTWN